MGFRIKLFALILPFICPFFIQFYFVFVFRLLRIRVTVFFATYLLLSIYSSALLKQCSGAIVRFSDSSSYLSSRALALRASLVWYHHLKQLFIGTSSLLQCPTSAFLPLSLSGCHWRCLSQVWSSRH